MFTAVTSQISPFQEIQNHSNSKLKSKETNEVAGIFNECFILLDKFNVPHTSREYIHTQ